MCNNLTIKRSIEGDLLSQSELYDSIRWKYFKLAFSFTHSQAEANDIINNSYIKMMNKFHTLRDINTFWGWVKKIIYNEAITYTRSRARLCTFSRLDDCLESHRIFNEDDSVYSMNYIKIILDTLETFPEKRKETLLLRIVDGLTHEQIAKKLNIALGTSKSNYKRGLDVLKATVKKNYVDDWNLIEKKLKMLQN